MIIGFGKPPFGWDFQEHCEREDEQSAKIARQLCFHFHFPSIYSFPVAQVLQECSLQELSMLHRTVSRSLAGVEIAFLSATQRLRVRTGVSGPYIPADLLRS